MPDARLPMNHAREILRLSRERKMSGRAIAQSLSLSPSTISKYLRQLEPVPWPLPDSGGEALLAKVLEKKKAPAPSARGRTGLGPGPSGASEPQGRHPPAPLGRVPGDGQGAGIFLLPLLHALRCLCQAPEAVFPEHLHPGRPALHRLRRTPEAVEALGLMYVTRCGAGVLDELLAELPGDQSPELWDRTGLMEIVKEGKRYVIDGGPWRQERDRQRREARMTKAESELKRLAAVPRQKVSAQKLASQAGRLLQRLTHKSVD